MKTLRTLAAALLASTLLVACGGQPKDYKNTNSSVFVWRDDAYAEHPAVAREGDAGTPKSARKALIGKTVTMNYTVNGADLVLMVEFTSQVKCNVRTNIIDGNLTTYPAGSYSYVVNDEAGKKSTLTVSFDAPDNYYQFKVAFDFQSPINSAPTTVQEFRSSTGTVIVPVGTRATTSTWALTAN